MRAPGSTPPAWCREERECRTAEPTEAERRQPRWLRGDNLHVQLFKSQQSTRLRVRWETVHRLPRDTQAAWRELELSLQGRDFKANILAAPRSPSQFQS